MRVYRDGAFIEDRWRHVGDDEPVSPESGAIIVSLARWRSEPELRSRAGEVGVLTPPSENPDVTADGLLDLPLIVIPFPKFTDGRGYSLGRMLRERHGFTGELRATGEVLLDQVPLMLRCGFNSFEVSHGPTLAALERGHLPMLPLSYQSPTSGRRRYSTTPRRSEEEKVAVGEQGDGASQT